MKTILAALTIVLSLWVLPALAADPGFDIEALCRRADTDKAAISDCIAAEKSVKEEVLSLDIPPAVFDKCLAAAQNDPDQANYYAFKTCVEEE